MPVLDLNGIDVNFPYEPYDCQINYMKSVLESITQVIYFLNFQFFFFILHVLFYPIEKKCNIRIAHWHW